MHIRKPHSPVPYPSLFSALGLSSQTGCIKIAAVGSGGKTSLLFQLAGEARNAGLSVLLLPTTHMELPERDAVLTGRPEDTVRKLQRDGFAIAGIPVKPDISKTTPTLSASTDISPAIKKIGFPGWETYQQGSAYADVVLVEADGSRRLPLKFPNDQEPVIPKDIQLILAVTGMSALSRRPQEVCHRLLLAKAALLKASWEEVTMEDMLLLQQRGYLSPLRAAYPEAAVIPVWNQADTPALLKAALSCLGKAGETDGLVTSIRPLTPP